MAETKSKDQQAFPDEFNEGMTLRDYFAAKAIDAVGYNKDLPYKERIKDVARLCYDIADAMLEARSK